MVMVDKVFRVYS